jgi:hypothetical protein
MENFHCVADMRLKRTAGQVLRIQDLAEGNPMSGKYEDEKRC